MRGIRIDFAMLNRLGTPPFDVKYQEHYWPPKGSKSVRTKDFKAALGIASVRMDGSQAGKVEYKFSEVADHNYGSAKKDSNSLVVEQEVYPRPTAQFDAPGKTYSYCSRDESDEGVIPVTFTGIPPFYLEVEIKHHGAAPAQVLNVPNINSFKHNLKIPQSHLNLGHSNIAVRKVRDARGCQRKPDARSPRVQISVHDAPFITPMETKSEYCVGERLSFSLAGSGPFTVFYTFEGVPRRATSTGTIFRRLAEKPGAFVITAVQDSASECKATVSIAKTIHGMPTVRLSGGRDAVLDIRAGGVADLLFEFGGDPPFKFTYTRSANARKGRRAEVLETRTEETSERSVRVGATEEGTYEVVSISDAHCTFTKPGSEKLRAGQKLLQ